MARCRAALSAGCASTRRLRRLDAPRRRRSPRLLLRPFGRAIQAETATPPPKNAATAARILDDRAARQRREERAPVRPRAQARIEDRDDAAIGVAADQSAEPLSQLEHRRRQRVVAEPVAPGAPRPPRSAPRATGRPAPRTAACRSRAATAPHRGRRRPARTSTSRAAPSRPRRGTARAAARAAPRPGRARRTARGRARDRGTTASAR